jgi:hypothetical protein
MVEPIIDPQQNNGLVVTLPMVDQVAVGQHMLGTAMDFRRAIRPNRPRKGR